MTCMVHVSRVKRCARIQSIIFKGPTLPLSFAEFQSPSIHYLALQFLHLHFCPILPSLIPMPLDLNQSRGSRWEMLSSPAGPGRTQLPNGTLLTECFTDNWQSPLSLFCSASVTQFSNAVINGNFWHLTLWPAWLFESACVQAQMTACFCDGSGGRVVTFSKLWNGWSLVALLYCSFTLENHAYV